MGILPHVSPEYAKIHAVAVRFLVGKLHGVNLAELFIQPVKIYNIVKPVAVSKSDSDAVRFAKMAVMPDLKSVKVGKFARKNIVEGTHISSDNASSYKKGLAQKYFHKFKTFDPDDEELVALHTFISNFKAFINGTYHGAERVHLQMYLDEFCFRFNRRNFGENLFERLLVAALECPHANVS